MVRKVFPALLFLKLIVSLVTAMNKIYQPVRCSNRLQQANFVCQSTTSMFLSFKIYSEHTSSVLKSHLTET